MSIDCMDNIAFKFGNQNYKISNENSFKLRLKTNEKILYNHFDDNI